MKKQLLLAAVMGFSLFLLSLAVVASPSAEKVKFGTSLKVAPHHILPVVAAQEKGYWKRQGVDVEWVPFDSGRSMFGAVTAGAVQMGVSGTVSTLRSAARGIPIVIVADMQYRGNTYFWVRTDSPIKRPEDLKGAKIGVARFGGMIDAYGRFMAKALGLEREVKFVAAGGAAKQIAAMRAGRLDASTSEYFPIAALKCKGVVREVVGIRQFLPEKWTDLIVFARNDLLDRSPALLKKVVTGILQGADFVQSNRGWAVEKMKSVAGYSESCARDSYGLLKYGKEGRIDPKVISNVRRFIIDLGLIAEEKFPPVDKLYTGRITG